MFAVHLPVDAAGLCSPGKSNHWKRELNGAGALATLPALGWCEQLLRSADAVGVVQLRLEAAGHQSTMWKKVRRGEDERWVVR